MAISISSITLHKHGKTVFGNKRVTLGYIILGTSDTMPQDGLSFTSTQMGLRGVDIVVLSADSGTETATAPNMYQYDYINQTIQIQGNSGNVSPSTGEKIFFMAVGYGTI